MQARPQARRTPAAVLPLLAAVLAGLALAGCGSALRTGGLASAAGSPGAAGGCDPLVMHTLQRVLERVYREGVSSERTLSATRMIAGSLALREAVERGDARAAAAAARALIATGHVARLRVDAGGHVLVDAGRPALAPLRGTITGASGRAIAQYTASVWTQNAFVSESAGLTQSRVSLRADGVYLAGSHALPPQLAAQGHAGSLLYVSFAAQRFPAGRAGVYMARSAASLAPLCGASAEQTVANTLQRVAGQIYSGEAGSRARLQLRRVQAYAPLLRAVARRDPAATLAAEQALLHHHLVRLRVTAAGGRLLADDGGPFVLAPVSGPLRLGGRTIGRAVLSIQDDEGYLRLARRLAGLDVLMYMGTPAHARLVRDSLDAGPRAVAGPGTGGAAGKGAGTAGPALGAVPASGPFRYRARSFRVFTLNARAFPSGPLTIRLLVPLPYS